MNFSVHFMAFEFLLMYKLVLIRNKFGKQQIVLFSVFLVQRDYWQRGTLEKKENVLLYEVVYLSLR